MWTNVNFGEYSEKSLPQVIFINLPYFFWLSERPLYGRILRDMIVLKKRICCIRVPRSGDHIEHYYDLDGRYSHFEFVEEERLGSSRLSPTIRDDVLDLSISRGFGANTRKSSRALIKSFKNNYFPDGNVTKSRCEEFFAKSSNFKLENPEKRRD